MNADYPDQAHIDNGTCTECNRTVTYDVTSTEEEVCIRRHPFCTAPEEDRVDWRASCLHATACATKAEAERDRLSTRVRELEKACRAALAVWCPQDPGGDGADGDTYQLLRAALEKP